jgi:hypothetical protein
LNNVEKLFASLLKWVDWALLFARKYANYLALILLLVAGSKMFKLKADVNIGKK